MANQKRTIMVTIEKISTGFWIDSEDMPELNVFVRSEAAITEAVIKAVEYFYRHNHKEKVRCVMEVPKFGARRVRIPKQAIEIERRAA